MSMDEVEESLSLNAARDLYDYLEKGLAWRPQEIFESISGLLEQAGHKGQYHLLNERNFEKDDALAHEFITNTLIPLCYMRTAHDAHTDPEGEPAATFFKEYSASQIESGKPKPTMHEFVEFLYQSVGYSDKRNTYEKGLAQLFDELAENTDDFKKEILGRSKYGSMLKQWNIEFTLPATTVDELALVEISKRLIDQLNRLPEFEGKINCYPASPGEADHIIRVTSPDEPKHIEQIKEIVELARDQAMEKYYSHYLGKGFEALNEGEGDIPADQQAHALLIARKLYERIKEGVAMQPEEECMIMEKLLDRLGKDRQFHLLDSTLPKDSELAKEYIEETLLPFSHLLAARNLHFGIDSVEKNLGWLNKGFIEVDEENINDLKEKVEQYYERSRHTEPLTYQEGLADVLEQICDMPASEIKEIYDRRSQHGSTLNAATKWSARKEGNRQSWSGSVAPRSLIQSIKLIGQSTESDSIEGTAFDLGEDGWQVKLNKKAVGSRAELKDLAEELKAVFKEHNVKEALIEVPLMRDGSYTILVEALHTERDKLQGAFDHFTALVDKSQERHRGVG